MTSTPRVLVLRTAGTNCDRELAHAFTLAGGAADLVHISELASGRVALNDYQILGFPGGFSFGDDIAAGRIHAIEVRARLREALTEFIAAGKLVLGICNGFQVLVNARLLPWADVAAPEQDLALAANESNRFECRWISLRGQSSKCVWFNEDRVIDLPVAHGEGRLVPRAGVLESMREQDQIVFRYVDADGKPGAYPVNPNGSVEHIAGVCDPTGRVLGMMPHPERYVRPEAHPSWTRRPGRAEGDGLALFRNGIDFVKKEL